MRANKIPKIQPAVIMMVLFSLALWSCFCTPPEAPCSIETLLLEESAPPDQIQWVTASSPSTELAPSPVGVEKIGVSFEVFPQGSIIQDVYRFWDANEAHATYSRWSSWSPGQEETPFQIPSQLTDLRLAADAFHVGCNLWGPNQIEHCQYIAWYGPYVTELHATMIGINYQNFSSLIEDIDQKITNCLNGQK